MLFDAGQSQALSIATPDGIPLTAALPSVGNKAGIVVLHEVWGMTPPVSVLTARLANCGYIAAAPHLYHRIGDPTAEGKYAKARRFHDTLTVEGLTSDIESALAWVRVNGAEKVAVIGFSMGGTLALWAAATLHIDAAVTYYGAGLRTPRWPDMPTGIDSARNLKTPWLGIYAGKDTTTPSRDLQRLREILPHDVTQSSMILYPHAAHGFALDPASPRYAPEETKDASQRVCLFLKAHMH